jgi:hypothetical protein
MLGGVGCKAALPRKSRPTDQTTDSTENTDSSRPCNPWNPWFRGNALRPASFLKAERAGRRVRPALLAAAAIALLVPLAATASAPPAWAYVVAVPAPGATGAAVLSGSGTFRHPPLDCPDCPPGFVVDEPTGPMQVEVSFTRVSAQPACNSPAYAAAFHLRFATPPGASPALQGTEELVWGGQRLDHPLSERDHGFTPVGAQGDVHFLYGNAPFEGGQATVALDGPAPASAAGATASRTLTLSLHGGHGTGNALASFEWTGSGPAEVFGQLVQPPGPCLSDLP